MTDPNRATLFDALAAAKTYVEIRPLIGQLRLRGYTPDTDYEQRVLGRALLYLRAHRRSPNMTVSKTRIKNLSDDELRAALRALEVLT